MAKVFYGTLERLLSIVERKQKELEGISVQISQITKELKIQ